MAEDHREHRNRWAAWKKVLIALAVVLVAGVGWIAYDLLFTLAHLREAYAAWDTGSLLVEYLKAHENRWPRSWEDLLTVLDGEVGREIVLRGASAGDIEYARSLPRQVKVDWTFDPSRPGAASPVTRIDGRAFPIVWSCGDPNEMVRDHLRGGAKR